jgi:hypothetical protein
LLTASALVIRAVLGIDPEMAQDLVDRRADANSTELASLFPTGANTRGLNLSLPTVMTVDSIGYLNDGGISRRVSAVVQRQGVNGFRFLRWQDQYEGAGSPAPRQGQ